AIELLPHMERGKNINPVWAPDGRSLALVSDRTGISNVYLYDFGDGNLYQLTDVFTGVSGITPLSPCLSWARQADRMAFAYYEDGEYNVYAVDNPRSLRRRPFREPTTPPLTSLLAASERDRDRDTASAGASPGAATPGDRSRAASSVYRSPVGFRPSSAPPKKNDSTAAPALITVSALPDSAGSLPPTGASTMKSYHTLTITDEVARL